MADLAGAVAALVRAAQTEADPRRLRGTVEDVLAAFADASSASRNAAVDKIGAALAGAAGEHAATQVLALALGALVEAGASAERAWPPLAKDLLRRLVLAATFAEAALRKAKSHDLEAAIERFGAELAKKQPAAAAAWRAVPSRCLAAVACLTHSRSVRADAQANGALAEAAVCLGGAIDEVGYFLQALRIVDDETWLVLAPDLGRGWRVRIEAMPSNAELYVLLWDAIVRQPSGAALAGGRPERKAVAALQRGEPPARPTTANVPFELLDWTAVDGEGALRTAPAHDHGDQDHEHEHDEASGAVLEPDGLPADVPPFDDERIVLLRAGAACAVPITPSFEGLHPNVEIVGEVGAAEVVRVVVRIATARAAAEAMTKAAARAPSKRTAKTEKKAGASSAKARPPKEKRSAPAKKKRS